MREKINQSLRNFSQAIIQPVMFMSVIGLFIALSLLLRLDFMPSFIQSVGELIYTIMMDGGIAQLPVIFTVGLATALAKRNKTDVAILSIIVFLMFIYANNFYLEKTGRLVMEDNLYGTGQARVLGVQIVDMGVFLGIILGSLVGYIYNKYSDVQFPDAISIYGGSRFVYMILIIIVSILAVLLSHVWPLANAVIVKATEIINNTGALGVFLYGFLNRILIPTGLHHLIWMPFCFSPLGGELTLAGQTYYGAGPITNAQMANIGMIDALHESSKWQLFGFSKIFGTIGICLALISVARKENKEKVKGMIIPLGIVALLSGITEPLDFMFLFISPLLWLVHSLIDGAGQMLIYILGGQLPVFDGVIDAIPKLLIIPWSMSKAQITIIVGLLFIPIWYFSFKFLIERLDIQTPGREKIEEEVKPISGASSDVQYIIDGLGGAENISTLNNCFTRLRVELRNPELVDEALINNFKNSGIVRDGHNIQIIIGMQVASVRNEIASVLNIE